jgi:hypothetical protein
MLYKTRNTVIGLAWLLAAGLTACHHQPHYPEIGSVLVSSDPTGAEILIDGLAVHRSTPTRIDGLPVGDHTITLRKFDRHDLNYRFTIRPGQTTRLTLTMSFVTFGQRDTYALPYPATDWAVDRRQKRLYVATWGNASPILMYDANSIATGPRLIPIGGSQRRIAADARTNRIFCTRLEPDSSFSLVGIDASAGTVIRRLGLPGAGSFQALALSPDGNTLVVADSLGRRLVVIDGRLCAVIRSISLPGCPGDAAFGTGSDRIYVTYTDLRRAAVIDLTTGTEMASAPTGAAPAGLFWDGQHRTLGVCNTTDRSLTIIDTDSWAAATGLGEIGGAAIPSACWSREPSHLVILVQGSQGGAFNTVYLPTWISVKKFAMEGSTDGIPLKVARMSDSTAFLVLNTRSIWVVPGDL